jgi:uncharacterized protein YbjT (DUF2867 family)
MAREPKHSRSRCDDEVDMTGMTRNTKETETTFVTAGTGKTGRRVVEQLRARSVPTRVGSRSGTPPFDWDDPATWEPALRNVVAAYIVYVPDLAVPAAVPAITAFTDLAVRSGVRRLVLLSGRGEEDAQRCEEIVQRSGAEWTIVRASWFSQNFSEGFLRDSVLSGEVALPVGSVEEPFVDAEDAADVVVAALTEDRHVGQLYEITGPRLLTFADAIGEIAKATAQDIRYSRIPIETFQATMTEQHLPADVIGLVTYLFTTVLDGRNARPTDGVPRALGRNPRDFTDYVRDAAAAGAWRT